MSEPTCPLCNQRKSHPKRVLYGTPICKKCYSGFANRRQGAYFIDAVIWQLATALPMGIIAAMLVANAQTSSSTTASSTDGLELLLNLLPYPLFLIFAMKDGFRGQSLGKMMCGVSALDQKTYEPIGFGASLKRNLILIVPLLPLVVAVMLQKGYRLGDKWANTKVVWNKYRNHPLFTGQLACSACQYDLRGSVSDSCPECGFPIPESTRQAIQDAGLPQVAG